MQKMGKWQICVNWNCLKTVMKLTGRKGYFSRRQKKLWLGKCCVAEVI